MCTRAWFSCQGFLQQCQELAYVTFWTQDIRGDLSLDGKRYFVVAGLRVQHEDKVMLVPFFIPVENKSGLVVAKEVFQLIDYRVFPWIRHP